MDPQKCLANAKIFDKNAKLCPDSRCNGGQKKSLDARCHCQKPYEQNPCPYSADSPIWVDDGSLDGCYCCCSCFAYGTQIADTAQTTRAIETFVVGDTVLVATSNLEWVEREVEFSGGVIPDQEHGKTTVTVYFELAGEKKSIVVTPDHIFLTFDRKLKRAEALDVLTDKLIDPKGAAVLLLGKETGGWFKGLHHIATTQDAAENPDYHLLNSNGVITGDWSLQISKLPSDGPLAVVGQAQVTAAPAAGRSIFHQAVTGFDCESHRPEGFVAYSLDPSELPPGAEPFLRIEQAADIKKNTLQYPPSMVGGQEPVFFVFRALGNYYKDIKYYLEWEEDEPNGYVLRKLGANFVVINGGLVRTEGISIDGLYIILASLTGRVVGEPPLVPGTDFSCVGQGDYLATLAVLRNILFDTDYRARTFGGLAEITTLFGHIDPPNRDGLPGNTCDIISTDCRLSAFTAGRAMDPLPYCAGGPQTDFLAVETVTLIPSPTDLGLEIKFNEALNKESATAPENYKFKVGGKVVSVKMKPRARDTVIATVRIEPGIRYELVLRNILSKSGLSLENDEAIIKLFIPKK